MVEAKEEVGRSGNRLTCQIGGKYRHSGYQCFFRFDRGFSGRQETTQVG